MGWFKRFFGKKPGGSAFGNLLRKVGDAFTNGAYSAINPAMPCDSGSPNQGYGSVENTLGLFGCSDGGYLFKGLNPIGLVEGNVYGMPQSLYDQLVDYLYKIDRGIMKPEDLPQSFVDDLDTFFGEVIPPEISDLIGVDSNGDIVDFDVFQSAIETAINPQFPTDVNVTYNGSSQDNSKGFALFFLALLAALLIKNKNSFS